MAATARIPTLPGVTEEQVLQAMEIVEQVYRAAGVSARIEPRLYRDPEFHDWETIDIFAWIEEEVSSEKLLDLIRAVPAALRASGLYQPEVPISTFYDLP